MVKLIRACTAATLAALAVSVASGSQNDVAKYDPAMAITGIADTNGVQWIDGKKLPIEGRMFDNVDNYYDRLPSNITEKVNAGVRSMRHHTSGMLFRFTTDSEKLRFRWTPYYEKLAMDHMPSTGVSGIDVYRLTPDGWRYVKTGRIRDPKGGELEIAWTPGTPCLVNLPLYNGIKAFSLGIDSGATVKAMPPRANGVTKPVVFYGTSITHGGCASRPGLGFVNIVGRKLDVPVVGLGFSGSGRMELEMSEHLAAIDASCYILDCLWNMGTVRSTPDYNDIKDRKAPLAVVRERYEPFIRNLRAKRPGVPIIMAEKCDVFCGPKAPCDKFIKDLYDKLVAEGWKDLVYLPKDEMYSGDGEGTVDSCHPNDLGMMSMATAFGKAVREALHLR